MKRMSTSGLDGWRSSRSPRYWPPGKSDAGGVVLPAAAGGCGTEVDRTLIYRLE
jgi:hypothetical protein